MSAIRFPRSKPSFILWEGQAVSTRFPYLQVLLQGRPRHFMDEFSFRHPQMERGRRAKIFAPFDALDGFGGSISDKNAVYVDKIELDEEQRQELNRRLLLLRDLAPNRRAVRENRPRAAITYYAPCADSHSFAYGARGQYVTKTGLVSKVDGEIAHTLVVDGTPIAFDDILSIAFPGEEAFAAPQPP